MAEAGTLVRARPAALETNGRKDAAAGVSLGLFFLALGLFQ
jgi:hypothetical protein